MVKHNKNTKTYRKNGKVRDELRALNNVERQLIKLEKQRQRIEKQIVEEAGGIRKAASMPVGRESLGTYLVAKLRRRRLLFFMLGTVGVIMIWVGVWHLVEKHSPSPWASIGVGTLIIWLLRHYI